MKIKRIGSGANYGYSSVELDKPKISWDKLEGIIEVYQGKRKDFSGNSHHDYTIQISLTELSELMGMVGGDLLNSIANDVSQNFSPKLRELIRIQKACIGSIEASNEK